MAKISHSHNTLHKVLVKIMTLIILSLDGSSSGGGGIMTGTVNYISQKQNQSQLEWLLGLFLVRATAFSFIKILPYSKDTMPEPLLFYVQAH